MRQQQQNEELRQRTEQALAEAFPHISLENYRLLCWHCGIDPRFVENQQENEYEMG